MKSLLIILFCAFYLNATSQTNNTIITDANSVTINNGNITIGKIIFTTAPGSALLFKSFSQAIDTLKKEYKGEYKTVVTLIQPDGAILSKIVTLIFDKPVTSCDFQPVGSGGGMISTAANKEQTAFRFVISQYQCQECEIIIYSKEKIFTKIDGITGQVTQ